MYQTKLFRPHENSHLECEKGYKHAKVSIPFFLLVKTGCTDALLLRLLSTGLAFNFFISLRPVLTLSGRLI